MLDQQFGPPGLPPPADPPANNVQDEEEDDGGAVDGDIDSEVILAQHPSKFSRNFFLHFLTLNHHNNVQFEISLSQLRVSVTISRSLSFQTSFGTSSMNN